jgi:peptidoglycan/LPS O-acetylase OafA/YrhL
LDEGLKMKAMADRQYYIDWLRAGAMFLLVFFHAGRLFNLDPWHIENLESSFTIHVFTRILDVW